MLCFSKAKGQTLKITLTMVDMKNIFNFFRLKRLLHNSYNFENGVDGLYIQLFKLTSKQQWPAFYHTRQLHVVTIISRSISYKILIYFFNPLFSYILGPCINRFKHCIEWASKGECSKNKPFMTANCRRSCTNCGRNATKLTLP